MNRKTTRVKRYCIRNNRYQITSKVFNTKKVLNEAYKGNFFRLLKLSFR